MDHAIENTVRFARELMKSILSGFDEVDGVTEAMEPYDTFDALDDAGSPVGTVAVMVDEAAGTYAIVADAELPEQPCDGGDDARTKLAESVEARIAMLFELCSTVPEAGAVWAALSSTSSTQARSRIRALGGDPYAIMESLDRFFLLNPDL